MATSTNPKPHDDANALWHVERTLRDVIARRTVSGQAKADERLSYHLTTALHHAEIAAALAKRGAQS